MTRELATSTTIALTRGAETVMGDVPGACFVLIGAAAACAERMRATLPRGRADELLTLLYSAAGLLLEHGHGPLDLLEVAGRA